MSKTNILFGAFLISLGAAIFLFRENSLRQAAALLDAPSEKPRPAIIVGVPPMGDEEFRDALPWNRYAPKTKGESLSLHVSTAKKLSCNFGDFDAISGAIKRSDDKTLLLSLESLSVEDGVAPITIKISEAQFAKGFTGSLKIPANFGPRQLGLFLCKDSDNVGRCAVKPVADINQVLRENFEQSSQTLPAQAADRIYFFQYVYVDTDGAVNIFRHTPIAKQAIEILSNKFGKTFKANRLEAERMSLAKADLFTRTLKSVPLSHSADGFHVTLPGRDNSRCPSVADINKQLKENFPTPEHF